MCFYFRGGGGGGGGGGGRRGIGLGVRLDVNREVKFFVKIKKKLWGGGSVGGGVSGLGGVRLKN